MTACSTPLHEMLVDNMFAWLPCPYVELGPPLAGVGLMLWFTVFVIASNWSEGFKIPLAWTALFTPVLFGVLPGAIVQRLLGLLTFGVAVTLFLVWQAWRR